MAAILKPHGIKPRQLKIEGEKTRGYARAAFADAWKRYPTPGTDFPDGTSVLRRSEALFDSDPESADMALEQGGTEVPFSESVPGRYRMTATGGCPASTRTREPTTAGGPDDPATCASRAQRLEPQP
jgi:hypothetical protein